MLRSSYLGSTRACLGVARDFLISYKIELAARGAARAASPRVPCRQRVVCVTYSCIMGHVANLATRPELAPCAYPLSQKRSALLRASAGHQCKVRHTQRILFLRIFSILRIAYF